MLKHSFCSSSMDLDFSFEHGSPSISDSVENECFPLKLSSSSSATNSERNGELSEANESGESVASKKYVPKVIGCRKRKNFVPQKASYLNDPNFRGVTIFMNLVLVDGEWKLIMTPTFSLGKRKKRVFKPYTDSSEDEETTNNYYASTNEAIADHVWLVNKRSGHFIEKHCASCSAKKTPLWRDAEDGTPLCNACGIRYKKYKIRCSSCWHIPKKDEFNPRCLSCGSSYVTPRR